jgi:hypothetical protein
MEVCYSGENIASLSTVQYVTCIGLYVLYISGLLRIVNYASGQGSINELDTSSRSSTSPVPATADLKSLSKFSMSLNID